MKESIIHTTSYLKELLQSFTDYKMTLDYPDDDLNMAIIYLSCLIDRLERMIK